MRPSPLRLRKGLLSALSAMSWRFTIPIFLAVPQFAVVMLADPSNDVPLMVRAVCNLVAEFTLSEINALLRTIAVGDVVTGDID